MYEEVSRTGKYMQLTRFHCLNDIVFEMTTFPITVTLQFNRKQEANSPHTSCST